VRKILTGQGFTLGLVVVLLLAYWFPEHGLKDGALRTGHTTKVAVVAIFFLQGLNLSGSALRRGVTTWKLHFFTLVFGFVFLPLATWFCVERSWVPEGVAPGLVFLAILPTTISTSVVYSSASGGDAAAATFGAALSNLLGIFAVPAWTAWLIFPRLEPAVDGGSEGEFMAYFLWRLFWLIAVPLFSGLFARRFLLRLVEGKEAWLRNACFGCVLFIAYAGFCKGFSEGSALLDGRFFGQVCLWTCAFLGFSNLTAVLALKLSRFNWPQVITGFFAASQKSLAVGLPMGYLLFGQEHPRLFAILLPLILFHPLQLLLGAALCSRLRRSSDQMR